MLAGALQRHGIGLRTDLDLMARAWPERPACRAPRRCASIWRRVRCRAPSGWRRCVPAWRAIAPANYLVSTVDDIAWITSLRGADVDS